MRRAGTSDPRRILRNIGDSPPPRYSKLRHARLQRRWLDGQNLSGTTGTSDSPTRVLKNAKDLLPHAFAQGKSGLSTARTENGGFHQQRVARGKNHCAFDNVAQFTNVAGPGILLQLLHRPARNAVNRLTHATGEDLDEGPYQQRYIFTTFTQWRNVDWENMQAMIQVSTELAVPHGLLQVTIGGRNDPHVNRHAFRAAQPFEPAVLKHSQQLRLQLDGELPDLIEE